MKKWTPFFVSLIACLVCVTGFAQAAPAPKSSGEHILVGRITHVEGQLLRYVSADQDWVATVKDAPFGLDDALYSNDQGKAEFKLPNGTLIRIAADTQIQLIALSNDAVEADVSAGVARFYNKSRDVTIKVTTPYGYVAAGPGSSCDLYVGTESAELLAIDGSADFVIEGADARYTVQAGGPSIISDGRRAVDGEGTVDTDWDEWNLTREEFWTQKVMVKGESVRYLPDELSDEAQTLESNGRWEKVYYGGEYRTLWRPSRAGYVPFTDGRWTVWHDDNCWVPEEEFGYVTHHYGNWVRVDSCGCWYWAPPVRVRIGFIGDCACWYPGRVAWIHTDVNVGWVPLAPTEVYYSYHPWGAGAVVVGGIGVGVGVGIGVGFPVIAVGALAFAPYAVVVPQANIYSVSSYSSVRITNISRTTIINNYHGAAVVNNTVVANYSTNHNRHNFNNNLQVTSKPSNKFVDRIGHNKQIAAQTGGKISGKDIRQSAAKIKPNQPVKGAQIQKPTVGKGPAGAVRAPVKAGVKGPTGTAQPGLKGQKGPAEPGMKGPRGPAEPGLKGQKGPAEPGMKGPRGPVEPGLKGQKGPAEPGMKGPRGPVEPGLKGQKGPTPGDGGPKRPQPDTGHTQKGTMGPAKPGDGGPKRPQPDTIHTPKSPGATMKAPKGPQQGLTGPAMKAPKGPAMKAPKGPQQGPAMKAPKGPQGPGPAMKGPKGPQQGPAMKAPRGPQGPGPAMKAPKGPAPGAQVPQRGKAKGQEQRP